MIQEEAKDLWPLIKAWSEGKIVQFQGTDGVWRDFNPDPDLSFNYPPDCYRLKPEPRRIFINRYPSGWGNPHPSFEKAKEKAKEAAGSAGGEAVEVGVEFVEVLK